MTSEDFLAFRAGNDSEVEESTENAPKISNQLLIDVLPPWLPIDQNQRYSRPFVRLHNEIIHFTSYLSPSESESSARELVESDLRAVVAKLWPEATMHVFGSQMTNLLIPGSDMDISIMNVPMKNDSNREMIQMLEALADVLRYQTPRIVSYLEVVSSAKFPIVKLDHKATGISVDICINNGSGLDTGNLMRTYLQSYPMLKPLALVIKVYLSQRRLHETYNGGVGSFVLLNMIISLIQQRQRTAAVKGSKPSWNLGVLLLEFFRFYGSKFNYITTGISISNGGYYCKQTRGDDWGANKLTLSVENPDPAVQPPVDIGKNSFMISKVRRSFEHGSQVLTSILCADSASIVSYLVYLIRQDHPYMQGRSLPSSTPIPTFPVPPSSSSSVTLIGDTSNSSSQSVETVSEDRVNGTSASNQTSLPLSTSRNNHATNGDRATQAEPSRQVIDLESPDEALSDGEIDEEDGRPRKRHKVNSSKKSFSILGGNGMDTKPYSQSSSKGNSYLQRKINTSRSTGKRSFERR